MSDLEILIAGVGLGCIITITIMFVLTIILGFVEKSQVDIKKTKQEKKMEKLYKKIKRYAKKKRIPFCVAYEKITKNSFQAGQKVVEDEREKR